MDPQEYQLFTDSLLSAVEGRTDVVGLVALGSMAQRDYGPDEYSDHDFFVVAQPGAAEALRTDVSWLPQPERVTFAFRETEHGVKVVYDDAHLLEFAMFEPEDLRLARVNRYRVLLDRGDVTGRMEQVAEDTAQALEDDSPSDENLVGQLLTNLLVGVGRWRRGERLSGRVMVQTNAVRQLLVLLSRHVPSARAILLDSLEPTRRFERVHPLLGAELDDALSLDFPDSAVRLLDLAEWELRRRVPSLDIPIEAFALVRKQIAPV